MGLVLDLLSYVEIFINTQNVIHGILLQFFPSLQFCRKNVLQERRDELLDAMRETIDKQDLLGIREARFSLAVSFAGAFPEGK